MSNQITHAEYESKVKQCQNSMSATRFAIIGLKERIADDRERWEEGNNYRTKWGLSNKHHMEWQVPGGKLRMEAIMDRVTCQERELKFLETHMDKMRGSILDLCDQRFLDSMTPVAVPVSESPRCADTPADAETSSGTCCPGAEQNTADSSSSDDEDDNE